MQIVILAGGLGTRLRKVVRDVPKPMAPVNGKPFLEYIIKLIKENGYKDILMLVGYKSEKIKEYFKDGSEFGVSIKYSVEKEHLGTGGAIFNAWNHLEEEFILINGDTFFDIEYDLLVDFVRETKANGVVVLRYSRDLKRYGLVEIDDNYNVEKFVEKTAVSEDKVDGFINGGIYYFRKKIFEPYYNGWNKNRFVSLEKGILPKIVISKKLKGLPMCGKFIDIGIPEDYERAQKEIPGWLALERKPAVFLDRDGVIIEDTGYPVGTKLKFIEKAFDIVKKANKEGKYVIVVTNQAGVAKGKFTEEDVILTNNYIKDVYRKRGLKIDAFYYCPYHPEGIKERFKKFSLARKPQPGMILIACEDFRIRLKDSIIIGDKPSDSVKLWGLSFVNVNV